MVLGTGPEGRDVADPSVGLHRAAQNLLTRIAFLHQNDLAFEVVSFQPTASPPPYTARTLLHWRASPSGDIFGGNRIQLSVPGEYYVKSPRALLLQPLLNQQHKTSLSGGIVGPDQEK